MIIFNCLFFVMLLECDTFSNMGLGLRVARYGCFGKGFEALFE
jgi:hypothetical protein